MTIFGEIDDRNEAMIRRQIEDASAKPKITVHIDSNGGFIRCAEQIARDLTDTRRCVVARVRSNCNSAAIIPLGVAERRIAFPHSCFYLHAPTTDVQGELTAAQLRQLADGMERCTEIYRGQLAGLGLPDDLIALAMGEHGLTLNGHDAVRLGLIHELQ